MTVSAALASSQVGNGGGTSLRFRRLFICRNRSKPEVFQKKQQLVFLNKSLLVPSTTPTLSCTCVNAFVSGAEIGVRRREDDRMDAILSTLETVCLLPTVVLAVGSLAGVFSPGMAKIFLVNSGNVLLVWQFSLLACAVSIGCLIQRRRWQRFCRDNRDVRSGELSHRVQKVEEDLRSTVRIVRVLSRQLEKLGIRFRLTRKALKEPIATTTSLGQKNSEATRALALQGEIIEKELGEIQRVLLAMQEQQQKQLELVLAVAKAAKLLEKKQDYATDVAAGTGKNNSVTTKKEVERTNHIAKIRRH